MTAPLAPDRFLARLRDEGERRYHDRHPFNRRMHEGALDADALRRWVLNRYYYQTRIPIKDAASKSYPLTPDIAKAPTNGPFKYENASSDSVVLVTQRRSDEALFRSLKDDIGVETLKTEGVDSLYRIGDCEAPRLTADAIFSGHRLAREIDSDNPAVALPFKRERKVIERELASV